MTIRKSLKLSIYFLLGVNISLLFNVLFVEAGGKFKIPEEYQNIEAGSYIDEYTQLFTYETICSGYYIVDRSNANKTKYTGYGPLADKYTYEEIPFSYTDSISN
jgi:hypothetical protein